MRTLILISLLAVTALSTASARADLVTIKQNEGAYRLVIWGTSDGIAKRMHELQTCALAAIGGGLGFACERSGKTTTCRIEADNRESRIAFSSNQNVRITGEAARVLSGALDELAGQCGVVASDGQRALSTTDIACSPSDRVCNLFVK